MTTGLAAVGPQVAASNETPQSAHDGQSAQAARTPIARDSSDSPGQAPRARPARPCRFFASKQGCRAGTACPFRHDDTQSRGARGHTSAREPAQTQTQKPTAGPLQRYTEPANAVVERPVAQAEVKDPRAFQISQLVRRYAAKQDDDAAGGSLLRFTMAPSDPDFPFQLDSIQCTLHLPHGWPNSARPSLKISNKEMERGYQVNIERGFDAIWAELRQKTLLNAMKLLDRRLEALLSTSKAEMITIVANGGPRAAGPASASVVSRPAEPLAVIPRAAQAAKTRPLIPPSFERLEAARSKRKAETKSLEHRMGRESSYSKEADGAMYQLPLDARKRQELPTELQSLKAIRLFVPEQYDIDPCAVELLGVEGQACLNVEAAFARRARERSDLTLMAHVNFLAQNIHTMAQENVAAGSPVASMPSGVGPDLDKANLEEQIAELSVADKHDAAVDTDKAHVKVIQRPLEWDLSRARDHGDRSSDDDDSSDASDSDTSPDEAEDETTEHFQPRETGVMVSLPGLELFNIELLEIAALSLTVKCSRCKETSDVHNLKSSSETEALSHARSYICKKCSLDATVCFRGDLMHAGSRRAGYLDLDNCEPLDILPSHFLPTCANCSTTHASPGVVSTRASSDSLAICRGCHGRMLFKLPQVHFLRVGPSVRLAGALPRKSGKRATESERVKLGIVPGTELPRQGTCAHYRKSFRWFRFSCCEKLYACDRCHDQSPEGGAHPQEFANRIVCGWCSREQRYRPEDCAFCGKSMVGKKGRGFWEGGKGTRNPAQMSRKDPRKYKLRKKIKLDQAKAKEKNER